MTSEARYSSGKSEAINNWGSGGAVSPPAGSMDGGPLKILIVSHQSLENRIFYGDNSPTHNTSSRSNIFYSEV